MPGSLTDLLQAHADAGTIVGATALVAHGDDVEVAVVGHLDAEQAEPMRRDTIFRVASVGKPLTAAAALLLVQDGVMALDDPIDTWIPELADPRVVRRPDGPVDDTVPAARAITVEDVLTMRTGWGFPSEFSWPAVQLLFEKAQPNGFDREALPAPDVWVRRLAEVPLLHQPGEGWLYNTSYDVLGVLIARASGRALGEVMGERLFAPLGMVDTGFEVPAGQAHRLAGQYRAGQDGGLEPTEPDPAAWTRPPAFPSGAGGLVSTLDDWAAFGRMLLSRGRIGDHILLTEESVHRMTTDHLTPAQRELGAVFLEGQGWGYGGSVDIASVDPWIVPGRYGWVGGSGTSAHVVPGTRSVAVLLAQLEMQGPLAPGYMRDFWTYARG